MAKSQYQPVREQQLSDAQEVHYAKEFKQADIAAGYRKTNSKDRKNSSK